MPSIFWDSNFSFEGQLKDEHTALVLRSHWFILLKSIIGFIILGLIPFVVYVLIRDFLINNGFVEIYWFLASLYFLVWWSSLFYRLMLYFPNVWIVTDHRILASEQLGLFNRNVSELNIVKVQDVEVKISGLIATFLNFGDVEIQSAGEEKNFIFKNVPNPIGVKDTIIEAQRKFLTMHPNGSESDGV